MLSGSCDRLSKSCLAVWAALPLSAAFADGAEPPETSRPLHDCRYKSEFPESLSDSAGKRSRQVFPNGDLFRPLIADPKQPQFVIGRRRVKPNQADDFVGAWVAYGENFGIYRGRLGGPGVCNGWQVNINGGVFAQFNVSAPSSDLINADYVIGFPVTFRKDDFSARLRLYHQSSHLGDEFILGAPGLPRINLSFEALEFLMSYESRI